MFAAFLIETSLVKNRTAIHATKSDPFITLINVTYCFYAIIIFEICSISFKLISLFLKTLSKRYLTISN